MLKGLNIYLHELKSLRRSTVLWMCALIVLATIFLSIYPSVASDAADFKQLLGNYPATVRAMLGINLDYITSILGLYSMVFSFIILCGAVQAMNLGTSILSKESRERTADFLLVKPVSRTVVVTAKLLAALTAVVATNIIFNAATFALANAVKTSDFDWMRLFMINLSMFFVQLIFLSIGVAVSVFFNKLKTVLPISLGVVFGLYMIGALIATGKDDEAARFVSPFQYFNTTYIIKHAAFEAPYLIAGSVIVVAGIILSYVIYNRKDIHAVS